MKSWIRIGAIVGVIAAVGCGGRMPEGLGPSAGGLAPCPSSPNCVSSAAEDEVHAIAAYAIDGSLEGAWQGLQAVLADTPRVEIVTARSDYIHAVFTSALMRYRDDVEFWLRPGASEIAVRSASRVGYGDMGANRTRIDMGLDACALPRRRRVGTRALCR